MNLFNNSIGYTPAGYAKFVNGLTLAIIHNEWNVSLVRLGKIVGTLLAAVS